MTFANNLSLSTKVLTTAGWVILCWVSVSGCAQRPLSKLQKNSAATAQAGAPAKGTTADKKATTGKDQSGEAAAGATAKSGSSANSGDTANSAGSNAPAAAVAGSPARPASAGSAAPAAANPKAIPACDGKVDENACDDTMLYHCVNGAYEGRAQACKTAAQCQAGLTTGKCGECDPGTFQCDDIALQRCDDTGAWVLEMECASAKLCKEDTGICDVQVCQADEYKCTGDQLQTCNADFSDFIDEGAACEPGLCSAEAKSCLECLPGTPAACSDERTVMTCTDEGMQAPKPCGTDTPFCAAGACVQCNTASDCGASMNECGTLTCTTGMCVAGSPQPKGTSCSANGGKMCDFLGSCVTCVTDLDCNDSTKRCYLQQRCVPKDAVTATALFTTWSVTVSPGFRAIVTTEPTGTRVEGARGNTLEGSLAIDATFLLGVDGYAPYGLLPRVASGDGSVAELDYVSTDPMCTAPCPGVKVNLRAEKVD